MSRHIFIISLLLWLTACGTSPKTNFYILDAGQKPAANSLSESPGPAIGLWQVQLPDMLERSQIVTRSDQFEIDVADFHWWAGSLKRNVTLVLASELSQRLQTDQIVISPWTYQHKNDYEIKIYIERFDGALGGEVELRGTWSLLDVTGKKEPGSESFAFKVKAADNSYKAMVAAMSQLTVKLAEQVANTIAAYKPE
ncbi:MAG: PqiC family protein [Gammaproteobacteria bacterium]|nr:PqiC family protein [Gammaproteobacteria bacterium]